tara:strand:- start:361 stop:741 length:381 start_codon:yes stop_codon:yes gene_type:complete
MAGRIIILEDYVKDAIGNKSATILFIYEISAEEKMLVGSTPAKPQSASELLDRFPEIDKYNLVDATDQGKFDTGDMVFDTIHINSWSEEPETALADKAKQMYDIERAIYIASYTRKYESACQDIPL